MVPNICFYAGQCFSGERASFLHVMAWRSARGALQLISLKQQEIQLKSQDIQRKAMDDESRRSLDKAKLNQNAKLTQDKIDSQEDIAQLRANVNLSKQK